MHPSILEATPTVHTGTFLHSELHAIFAFSVARMNYKQCFCLRVGCLCCDIGAAVCCAGGRIQTEKNLLPVYIILSRSKMARRLRGQALNPLFHKQNKKEDEGQLSLGLIKQARNSGSLNLSGRGLATGKASKHRPHSNSFFLFNSSIHVTSESDLEIQCSSMFLHKILMN